MWLLLQSGRGKEKRGDHGRASGSSCQRKPSASFGVGLSLRAVTERCLSPISGRRSSRTLPCSDSARRDTVALSTCQQSHTLPATLRSSISTNKERQSPAYQDGDDTSSDSPWLECTHFGAEIRQISPPTTYPADPVSYTHLTLPTKRIV